MGRASDFAHIPIIDVSELVAGLPSRRAVAERLGEACRESGFFYVVGHGVDEALQARLRDLSREFFAQDLETKLRVRMALGGRSWRGYFRVGDELTSSTPYRQVRADYAAFEKDLATPEDSGLAGERVFLARVIHRAFVEVTEEGTEAAAATGVRGDLPGPVPPPPVDFRADRPFLFLIRDVKHGTILFLGRVTNPKG